MASKTAEKSDADVDLIRRLRADGKSVKKIAQVTGFSLSTVSKYVQTIEATGDDTCESVLETEGDRGTYQGMTDKPIKSEEDALVAFNIDRSVWKVKKMSCTAWTVGLKVKRGEKKSDRVIQTQQYRVRLELERILPKVLHEATDAIFERMRKYSPKYTRLATGRPPKDGQMAVVSLSDVHFGMLSWAKETGASYDVKIAESVYRNGVTDLLAACGPRPIDRFLLPLGNDLVHIDSRFNTTHAGTPQDVDGRYAKVIEAVEMAVVWGIERLMRTAPVEVVWVPGNHDTTTSYHVARTIQAWFRNSSRVTVDVGASTRKYTSFGCNLLGFTHGNEEKVESLPTIMATEKPGEWGLATCREWILGHMHRSRKWVTKPVDTHDGVTIRVMRSPASGDAWHTRKGYVSPPSGKSVECYWYCKSRGYIGHAVSPARAG